MTHEEIEPNPLDAAVKSDEPDNVYNLERAVDTTASEVLGVSAVNSTAYLGELLGGHAPALPWQIPRAS